MTWPGDPVGPCAADRATICCLSEEFHREDHMSVVIAYMVLEGATRELLEAAVKDAIRKGWQPIGGIAVSGSMFYQAMGGH